MRCEKVSKMYPERKVNKKNMVFSMILEFLNHCQSDMGISVAVLIRII